eukprot:2733612-Pyramimonas_sp.AAC.1
MRCSGPRDDRHVTLSSKGTARQNWAISLMLHREIEWVARASRATEAQCKAGATEGLDMGPPRITWRAWSEQPRCRGGCEDKRTRRASWGSERLIPTTADPKRAA